MSHTVQARLKALEDAIFTGPQEFTDPVTFDSTLTVTGVVTNSGVVNNTNAVAGIGNSKIVRQSADVTATTNVTLANLTGLVQTVVAGTYEYNISLQTLATANGGVKAAFKLTSTVLTSLQNISRSFVAAGSPATARTTTTTDQASLVAATAAYTQVDLKGTIVVGTGGTIQLQGAQNASHSDTTTFYTGSTFELTRIS